MASYIFHIWGCRHSIGGVPLINQKAKEWNVAFLDLDSDCVDKNNHFSGQIKTRLESFAEMLLF